MKREINKRTKREQIHFDDMRRELEKLVKAQKELNALKQDAKDKEDQFNKEFFEFSKHYLGYGKEDNFTIVEMLERALK